MMSKEAAEIMLCLGLKPDLNAVMAWIKNISTATVMIFYDISATNKWSSQLTWIQIKFEDE